MSPPYTAVIAGQRRTFLLAPWPYGRATICQGTAFGFGLAYAQSHRGAGYARRAAWAVATFARARGGRGPLDRAVNRIQCGLHWWVSGN